MVETVGHLSEKRYTITNILLQHKASKQRLVWSGWFCQFSVSGLVTLSVVPGPLEYGAVD